MSAPPPLPPPTPAPGPEQTLRKLFLTLFLRGRGARGLTKSAAPKSVGTKLAFTLLFYALFGLVALMFLRQPVFALSVYLHAMTLMFLGMFVASSAGEVLFNKEEADILMHRPVTPRALLWAKIGVLVQVSLWLAGAFNLAGFLVVPDRDADAFDAETLAKVTSMMDDLMQVEDATPDPPAFMGVGEGNVVRAMPIHIRGSYLTLGKEIERGFPEVMRTSFIPAPPHQQG